MAPTIQIINRVLPIVLLLALGYVIRTRRFLSHLTIDELRKFVINVTLPAVLFISFLEIELKSAYLIIFGLIFGLCVLLFLLGQLLKKQLKIAYDYFPFLTTGFEYGLLGVSLFGSGYGLEQIGTIAIVDLGHEIFVWFFFLPLLLLKRDGRQSLGGIGRSFVTSPVVLAILTSLALNLLGVADALPTLPVTGAIITTLTFLGSLTIPLILLIVGYGIEIDRRGLRTALSLVALRLALLIPLAMLINVFVIRGLLQLDGYFEAAVFTLLILPPPFIVPLYTRPTLPLAEKQTINNVLIVHTLVTIALYIVYVALNPLSG
jgi:predicted permease